MKRLSGFLLLALTIQVQMADAGTIFDNGMTPGTALGGLISDFDSGQYLTDNFNLAEGFTTIRDIHWLGVYGTLSPDATIDDFTIRFYNTDGGPEQLHFTEYTGLSVNRTNTGFTTDGLAIFEYTTVIPDLALSAGPTYWISIVNDTSAYETYNWAWVRLSGGGDARFRSTTPSGAWSFGGYRMAFSLTDDVTAVPEPSTFVLLGLGSIGCVAFARKRRHARKTAC